MWGQQVLHFKSDSALKFETNVERGARDFTSLSLSGLIFPNFSRG